MPRPEKRTFPTLNAETPEGSLRLWLPCLLLLGAMFNLTLVVAGLKEFILDDLGGTVADATLFFSLETLAYILFAPVWGIVSDRLGRRRELVVLGFAMSALFYLAYGQIQSVQLLLGLRFLQGAASVMGWSLVMASVVDRSPEVKRGRIMGLMGASLIFGVAMGAPFGGYLTRWAGARAPLLGAAVLFACLAFASMFLTEGRALRKGIRISEITTAMRSEPRLLLPLAFHFVDRLAVGLFVVVLPLYLDSMGGADAAVRGRYLSFFLIPFALLQYVSGRLSERTGPWIPLLVGSFLYGTLLCFVGYADLLTLAPIMVGLGVLAAVMFPPAILLVAEMSDERARGSAMGSFNLAGSMGFAVGPLLGGWAYSSHGFAFAFLVCGLAEIAVVLGSLAVIVPWRRRERTAVRK